jgi:hypothetical protein
MDEGPLRDGKDTQLACRVAASVWRPGLREPAARGIILCRAAPGFLCSADMKRLALQTTVSHFAHGGGELRVVRIERAPERIVVQASHSSYDIHTDRRGAECLAAAWALARRSPRSLVHLPIRGNRPPACALTSPTLDLVFVHAAAQFRVSGWKAVRSRARSSGGARQRISLGTIREELPGLDDVDFRPTRYREYRHHLDYATAAETLFVIGSAPAFERDGAFLRAFVEEFEEPVASGHHCVELWPTRDFSGRSRRSGPGGLHIVRETELWPGMCS